MKKLLLLFVAGSLTTGVLAQQVNNSVTPVRQNRVTAQAQISSPDVATQPAAVKAAASKSTSAPAPRWYSHFDFIDDKLGGAFTGNNYSGCPLWYDSTVLQRFSTGYSPVNFASVCDILSPVGVKTFNDPLNFKGALAIQKTDAYKVDSVAINYEYIRIKTKANIVDTLIISLFTNTTTWYWTRAANAWAASYLPVGKDTLLAPSTVNVDSINLGGYSDGTGAPTRLLWKVPLNAAMGDTITAANTIAVRTYIFAPPSTFTVPAGARVGVTYTFKTGESTWIHNVDSIYEFNRWMPMFGGTPSKMPYYWYDYNDFSGSGLMFYDGHSSYEPSVEIEGNNTIAFDYEALDNHFKLSCTTCYPVGISNVNPTFATSDAYPNPAGNNVTIPVTMKEDGNVSVNLMNMLGQVISTQNLGQVSVNQTKSAIFNTAELANGMYMYTVEANGQRATNRIMIAH